MKKTIKFFRGALAICAAAGIMLSSCSKKSEVTPTETEGEVSFSLALDKLEASALKSADAKIEDASNVIISVVTSEGEETGFINSKLDLYHMNGECFTQKIALKVGKYQVAKFLLVDKQNKVLFAAPLEGSIQAQNVVTPLPINFSAVKNQATSVSVEVLDATVVKPADFGLESFWIEEVETFSFLLAVAELGADVVLAGDIAITGANGYTFAQEYQAITNNVITIKDGVASYKLTINSPGYQSQTIKLTNEELKAYQAVPLVVELTALSSQLHDPILEMKFQDPINMHVMHITTDGEYYYTIDGGGAPQGKINQFDLNGNLIKTYPIKIDGRGLTYNKADGYLYASLFTGDIVRITNLEELAWEMVYENIMADVQASFDISPDGKVFYDFANGTLKVRDFATGSVVKTITGLKYGAGNYGGNACVAVDEENIYTWNSKGITVYVYDLDGNFVTDMTLEAGTNGHTLSVFDGKLFASDDDKYGGLATWYVYNIKNPVKEGQVSVVNVAPEKMANKDVALEQGETDSSK